VADELHAVADPSREKLMEAVAEADDELIEKYLEEGALSEEEIAVGVKAGFANARIAPVICGSAAKAIGIDRLLAFIAEEFPSPIDRGAVTVTSKTGEEKERGSDPADPLAAFVFKTVSDPFVGHITMFRVFSGKLRPDSSVFNATQHTEERIGQLFSLRGKDHENVSEVAAGDIGAVAKLQHTHTGDTLSTKDDPGAAPPDRAARAPARVRRRAEDEGRRGQALHRSGAPARGGPDASGCTLRRDARDRDVRHG
jgi:elongation factor G